MNETNLTKRILLHVSKYTNSRLFRNNTGTGWVGKSRRTKDGGIYIDEPRPLKAGLCIGSSDLIGWTKTEITPDMVGKNIAIFTALEVKTKYGKASKEQINFIQQVREAGGISGIARDESDSYNVITGIKF